MKSRRARCDADKRVDTILGTIPFHQKENATPSTGPFSVASNLK